MARDDPVKVPLVNLRDTPIESGPILRAGRIPIEALLPRRRTLRTHQPDEQPVQHAGRGRLAGARVLLVRGQVEEQVGFDERAVGPVIEDDFLVGVTVGVFVVEIGVELGVDPHVVFVRGRKDVGEVGARCLSALLSLFGQAFRPDEFGVGEGGRPLCKEDVVFEVRRNEVSDLAAEGGERFVDLGR